MAILTDSLVVWEIAFRWSGRNPRSTWLRIPLDVQDHFRNLMDAILSAELLCESIELEKREFEPDEKTFSIYFWLDDIHDCIYGRHFNRKLLRHASIDRYDFKLWCERRNIPLPEFWFPPGWNLEYELPEDELRPGDYYIRKDWTREDWEALKERQSGLKAAALNEIQEAEQPLDQGHASPPLDEYNPPITKSKQGDSAEKLRPNQEAAIACRQIAKAIWKDDPSRTIASSSRTN